MLQRAEEVLVLWLRGPRAAGCIDVRIDDSMHFRLPVDTRSPLLVHNRWLLQVYNIRRHPTTTVYISYGMAAGRGARPAYRILYRRGKTRLTQSVGAPDGVRSLSKIRGSTEQRPVEL